MLSPSQVAQAGNEAGSSVLEDIKTIVEIAGTFVTAAAVIAGGLWAYFKFVRGRTFRPRLEVALSGQWEVIDKRPIMRARVTVKNIGASDVTLLQTGTGLRLSTIKADRPPPPAPVEWESLKVFSILREHQWIEPGETVSDDLLLHLGVAKPLPTLFEARLVWRWRRRDGNIVVFARQVVPVGAVINGNDDSAAATAGKESGHE